MSVKKKNNVSFVHNIYRLNKILLLFNTIQSKFTFQKVINILTNPIHIKYQIVK